MQLVEDRLKLTGAEGASACVADPGKLRWCPAGVMVLLPGQPASYNANRRRGGAIPELLCA